MLRKTIVRNLLAKTRPLKKDIKLVKSLHQKKFRSLNRLFLVEGLKMAEEAIRSDFVLHSLYTTDGAFAGQQKDAQLVSSKEMEQMTALSSPSQHLAVLHFKEEKLSSKMVGGVIVLDGISDPGNLGTIIRCAEWFGISEILCTKDCVELYNPKVVQATMGSIFRTNLNYLAASEMGEMLRENNYTIVGAEMNGTSLFEYKFSKSTALVMGSESHGIREEMKKELSASITIPGTGKAESLNASVACSIMVAEYFRQLHFG